MVLKNGMVYLRPSTIGYLSEFTGISQENIIVDYYATSKNNISIYGCYDKSTMEKTYVLENSYRELIHKSSSLDECEEKNVGF